MKKLFLIFICAFYFPFWSYSQDFLKDTIKNDEVIINRDSLEILQDSIDNERIQDTLNRIFNIVDTINIIKYDTSAVFNDSICVLEESINSDSIRYNNFISNLQDSLIFEREDTVQYVIYNLNNIIRNDSSQINDSTKQAIIKLIDYTQGANINPVIDYLQTKLRKSSLSFESEDSSLIFINDSIINAIEYLINIIPEDSIQLSFTNLNNDSILFKAKENELDSIRFNLFDNRGEYAVLWIKKSDSNVFNLYLEDGIYLEKAKQRKVVDQKLDTKIIAPKLKKVDKYNKILPIWTFEGLANIKLNQGHVSESWAEGGESSMSALSILKYSADFTKGKKRNLDTDVEYRLGYLKAGENELQKNDDKFEINAKYGRSAFKSWYYSGLLNFKTQLLIGKDYSNDTIIKISEFLSPAYLVFSLGLDYKPSKKLTILISPITSKFTIVADTVNFDQTRFGLEKNEFIRKEIGAYIKAISKIKFKNNIILENKVNFFTNYTDNPQNIDVDWEIDLVVKLTDYIKMSINAHFIYDDDVAFIDKEGEERGARSQYKELFGIGFTYSF